jgi:hypothetical protein
MLAGFLSLQIQVSNGLAHLDAPLITPTELAPLVLLHQPAPDIFLALALAHTHHRKQLIRSHRHYYTFTFFLSAGCGCPG